MEFGPAIVSYFRNYATFSGRAPRSAFWWAVLLNVMVTVVAGVVDQAVGNHFSMGPEGLAWPRFGPIYSIYVLAVLSPSMSLCVRRLHDRHLPDWSLLLALIPIAGWLLLLIWFGLPGTPGDNGFGPDPLARKSN